MELQETSRGYDKKNRKEVVEFTAGYREKLNQVASQRSEANTLGVPRSTLRYNPPFAILGFMQSDHPAR